MLMSFSCLPRLHHKRLFKSIREIKKIVNNEEYGIPRRRNSFNPIHNVNHMQRDALLDPACTPSAGIIIADMLLPSL